MEFHKIVYNNGNLKWQYTNLPWTVNYSKEVGFMGAIKYKSLLSISYCCIVHVESELNKSLSFVSYEPCYNFLGILFEMLASFHCIRFILCSKVSDA